MAFHPVGMRTAYRRRERLGQGREVSSISDPQVERIDALFVQSATAFTSAPGTITLHGLADSTVYFADRPRREVGHMPSHKFVELWESGANTFAVDPPNAVLSFLEVEGESPLSSRNESTAFGGSTEKLLAPAPQSWTKRCDGM